MKEGFHKAIESSFLAIILAGIFPILIWLFLRYILSVEATYQLILSITFIPTGGLLAWQVYNKFSNNLVARTIIAYVLIALSFAGIYYLIYYKRPNNYSFSTSVISEAEQNQLAVLTDRVQSGYRRYGHLSNLHLWIESKPDTEVNRLLSHRVMGSPGDISDAWSLPDNVQVLHYSIVIPETMPVPELIFRDSLGDIIFEGTDSVVEAALVNRLVVSDKTKAEYLESLLKLETAERLAIQNASNQLRNLKPLGAFSLVDFTYFSVITVTTVGYGDIVPNSTLIRILVMCQILTGLMLVISASNDRHENKNDLKLASKDPESNNSTK